MALSFAVAFLSIVSAASLCPAVLATLVLGFACIFLRLVVVILVGWWWCTLDVVGGLEQG